MKNNGLFAIILAALPAIWPLAAAPRLKYVVIVSRHGVRSPTWETSRLNQYSAEPWPEWDVPPGNLTAHGRKLIEIMGSYYRDWLVDEHLLDVRGCADAGRIAIRADSEQRTVETGRAFAAVLLPGCGIVPSFEPLGQSDPLFSGAGTPDPQALLAALRQRLGADPQKLVTDHRAALDTLQAILGGKAQAPAAMDAAIKGKSLELSGPFPTGSTFSENLLLEYANGFEGAALGWGRLTRQKLDRVLEIHAVYADLMRRTPYLARVRGSNLLAHVLGSLEQAASGKQMPGAMGHPEDALLVLAGHDTNLSNLSGMLGLSWKLAGYQPDDTPPGGALIFSLWRDTETGQYSLKLRYVAQSLDQMRQASPLSLTAPPASQEVSIPGCEASRRDPGCSWESARLAMRKAIDPQFTSIESVPSPIAGR